MEQQQQQSEGQLNENAPLSAEQEQELIQTAIAVIPKEDQAGVQKVIKTNDIVLIDSHKKKLKNFKARFPAKKYAITDDLVFDKDTYEKALEQWREVKNYRTKNVEPDFKNLKAPYVAITKFYNETCNPVIADFKLIEKPISDYVDKLEALKKAEDEKAQRELEQRLDDRVDKIIKAGAYFDGEYYSIGSEEFNVPPISLDVVSIQTMTDGIFENVLGQIIEKNEAITKAQAEKDEAARIAEEQRLAAEAEEKRLFEEQQAKLKKEQDDLAAEMAEFKRQKEELRLAQEKLAQDKLDVENRIKQDVLAKKEAIKKERIQQLTEIGLNWDGAYYSLRYKGIEVKASLTGIEDSPAELWAIKLEEITAGIVEQKKLFAIDKEAEAKKAAEDKIISDKEIADKAIAFAKEKEEQDKITRQIELVKKGDMAVWEDFILRISAIPFPEMKSTEYKNKVSDVKDYILSLK